MELKKLADGVYRFQTRGYSSLLTRYNQLNENNISNYKKTDVNLVDNLVKFVEQQISILELDEGYKLVLSVSKDDIFYGLGDVCRDSLCLQNKKYSLHTSNVKSYGPIPVLINLGKWAIIINSTFTINIDLRESNEEEIKIIVCGGKPDFYLIFADSLKETIKAITDITGKPTLLPSFAYGLTIVQNENTNVDQFLTNIKTVRRDDISCDVFGLEPNWCEKKYDYSVNKEWNKTLFPLPYWHNVSYCGPQTFFYPMRENGMQLSLWLCENYDLFYEEERKYNENVKKVENYSFDEADIFDNHLNCPIYVDQFTKIDEPFFKHLEKFVDNGAACFKLDGSTQVLDHPDRLWGGKYLDSEIHNLYPLILAKQMKEGFAEYTDRRPLIYTSGMFLGEQKYVATWAGDTGGGFKPLNSLLNYAFVGHSNTTFDMDITSITNIHTGFLLSWAQLDVWSYYFYPWNLSEKHEEIFKYYSKLRSSLFPYIYMNAHNAYVTGLSVVKPLIINYEDRKFSNIRNEYLLGNDLLVAIPFNPSGSSKINEYFDSDNFKSDYVNCEEFEIILPDGEWVDYFDGKTYKGTIKYRILPNRGGALFAKKDSVIVTMKPQKYILEKKHDYIINVFGNGKTTLYEDDGFTFDYEKGDYQETFIESKCNKNDCTVIIFPTKGSFKGRPNNGHDLVNNSIPKINGCEFINSCEIIFHNLIAKKAYLNGNKIDFELIGSDTLVKVNEKFDQLIEIKIEQ